MTDNPKKSYFEQLIQYKALSHKFDDSDKIMDMVLNDPVNEEQINARFKNVCAKLPQELVERMEGTCGLLDMSKRRFIELAVVEALNRCDQIIDEVDPFEYHIKSDSSEPVEAAK